MTFYTFANATSAIPLTNLDANFATPITLGNTAVTINGTFSSIGNLTLNNATIASGNSTVTKETVTTITSPAATNLTIQSAGTTAMTIDTSQNVGIGTSSPSYKLDVSGVIRTTSNLQVAGGDSSIIRNGGNTWLYISSGTGYGTAGAAIKLDNSSGNGTTIFYQGVNESSRIDTSGNLLVGTTSVGGRISVNYAGLTSVGIGFVDTSTTGTTQATTFNKNGTQVGSIQTSNSATSYVTSSDYRLKKSVLQMTTGLATVAALKPVTYKWNSDESDGEGFIAHELQEVIPHAVTGEKDAVNEDGSIKPQGVDYSKIVVHLVAALQELKAEFDAYKASHP